MCSTGATTQCWCWPCRVQQIPVAPGRRRPQRKGVWLTLPSPRRPRSTPLPFVFCAPLQIFADVRPAQPWDRHTSRSSHDSMPPPSFPNICENFDGWFGAHLFLLNSVAMHTRVVHIRRPGRNVDVYRVLGVVLKQKLVTLSGGEGSGKVRACLFGSVGRSPP